MLASRHVFRTVNLVNVSADGLNTYMKLPVTSVTVQSAQEVYYFEGPIMKKELELSADYPNGALFQQSAIDNAPTRFELRQLELEHEVEQAQYQAKRNVLDQLRQELYEQTKRGDLSDYEEGKRRDRIRELNGKIAVFVWPEPVNVKLYQVRKAMLQHKLRETARLNATLLIWQLEIDKN